MYEDYNSNQTNYNTANVNQTNSTQMNNTDTDENPQYRYSSYQFNNSHIPEEPKVKPKKKGYGFRKVFASIALGLLFGIFAGTGLYAVNLFTNAFGGAQSSQTGITQDADGQTGAATVSDNEQNADDESEPTNAIATKSVITDASGVADSCMPSIVSITNMFTETYDSFWGQQGEMQNEASGSGIIVGQNDEELLIATNNHVIAEADQLSIQFSDGTTAEAQVKGSEADVDLAVIAVKISDLSEDTLNSIKVATLGDSESLKVGEPAIAIGNALGYGQSVTTGVISALNREVTVDNVTNELIQTDAAINPGNSGGALLNINGEVIGINAVKYSSTGVEGMGYAIPISTAKPIIDELMQKETKSKVDAAESAYLGISGVDVTQDVAQMYGMPLGVYVAQVVEGSAAESAGIVKGDIITEFDGQSVSSMNELKGILEYYAAGQTVDIKIQEGSANGYQEKTITMILGKKTS